MLPPTIHFHPPSCHNPFGYVACPEKSLFLIHNVDDNVAHLQFSLEHIGK